METYEQLQLNGFEQTESPGGGITVLSAGFPCQPYSLAGKGLGDGDSRDLWGEVARILREVRPKWFVGENTPGLFARSNQRFFRRVIDDITEIGYSVSWSIWGACDVGAPHRRDRVFIVGRNADCDVAQSCRADCISNSLSHPNGEFVGVHGSAQTVREVAREGGYLERRAAWNASREWWKAEPGVGRVVARISNRVDRLRCLGNAVVPYQALPIFEAIRKIEEVCEE